MQKAFNLIERNATKYWFNSFISNRWMVLLLLRAAFSLFLHGKVTLSTEICSKGGMRILRAAYDKQTELNEEEMQ